MNIVGKSANRVLIVEGRDDKHVVCHICQENELNCQFSIKAKEGIDELIRSMTNEVKVPERRAVGFLVDANDDVDGCWRAIRNRLGSDSTPLPEKPQPCGTVVGSKPRVGVWLMPDNTSTGELEDFVAKMILESDAVWRLAQRYIRNIPKAHRKFTDKKMRRAEVYAWLATREKPGPMGAAIRKGDLSTDGELCRRFAQWLQKLFG